MGKALVTAVLLALLPWSSAQESGGHDPARETVARAAVEIAPGKAIALKWRTIAWSDEGAARMRADPAIRDQMNQRLPVGLQSELDTPVALSINGRRLEPDRYRFGLWMDEAGAYQFSLLLDHELVRFPLELVETDLRFPYLTFALLPAPEGGFALVVQWGGEYGRLRLELAR